MSVDEAMNILNITKETDLEKIVKASSCSTTDCLGLFRRCERLLDLTRVILPLFKSVELSTLVQSERQGGQWLVLFTVKGCPSQRASGNGMGISG